jgi:peptidyl-tRNA hydrolase, PTH1 family
MHAPVRLIVGLGNPGAEYDATPHNLGFWTVDRLAERSGIRVERPESKSYVGLGRLADRDVALAKPQTYMNLSGVAVRELLARYGLAPEAMIVVFDDVALPWGMLRIRPGGSAGGHNGVESVIAALGTGSFPRVRIGIAPDHPVGDLAEYVLRPMSRSRQQEAAEFAAQAADAVEMILGEGVERAMSRFNRRAPGDAGDESEVSGTGDS